MLVNRADSHTSGAPSYDAGVIFHKRNRGAMGVYCKRQTHRPYISIGETERLPWCTVVSDHADPSTGGASSDPIRKLGILQVIGSALEKMVGANGVVFRTWARCLFVVNLMA